MIRDRFSTESDIGECKLPNIVYTVSESGCWEVDPSRARNRDGYPIAKIGGIMDTVYRHSYREHKGKIPVDQVVRHKCDNRNCMNPEHLELGTRQDNVDDMHTRNRAAVGERHGKSKLTSADIKYIRKVIRKGHTITGIAGKLGVDRKTIRLVRDGKTWNSLDK